MVDAVIQSSSPASVLNETDIDREFRPPAWARNAIACLWIHRADGAPVRVMPDACVDIVWRSGEGAVVAGPDTASWISSTRPGEVFVGARLLPGAGGAALGVPLSELRDQRVPLRDLGLDPRGRLDGALDSRHAPVMLAATALQLVAQRPPDRAIQSAALTLLDSRRRIEDLAESVGLSERHLRRRFHASVGYGPKTLQRVLRLRRFQRSTVGELAVAALVAGYSDQAHLSRDCRALTGLTPGELRAGR
jgi:AraC-like DNA-binding protein